MISETKEAVDHTTWETFPFFFFNNSASWVFYNTVRKYWYQTSPTFVKIREVGEEISVKFRCIYCSIIGEILRNETNCRCEFSFRLHENSAQNESSVLFVHFWWTINERNDEGNKAKSLKIMLISEEFITRKYLCKTPFCSFFPHCGAWSQANVVKVKYGILLLSFPIINLTSRSSGRRQGLKQTAEWHFLFDNEPLWWRLAAISNLGLPHAAYQLLYLAEIRLIRETDKPNNTQ